jgi:hypothetical protein
MLAPHAFQRWNACGAEMMAPAIAQTPMERSFLVLFCKKEPLSFPSFSLKPGPKPYKRLLLTYLRVFTEIFFAGS